MKNFLKMTLAVVCGLLLTIFLVFMVMGSIISAIGSAESNTTLPKSGVLEIDMSSFILGEQNAEVSPVAAIQGGSAPTIGIRQAVAAVRAATEDPAIKYIYLKTDGMASSGLALLEEFRVALEDCSKAGKAVISYIESPSTASYYMSSAADKIYMTSHLGATSMMTGVGSQLIFLKDLLDKLGVNVQLIRHGKYKSAGEMYIRNSSSPENMQQNQEMIDGIWNNMATAMAKGRELSVEDINAAIEELKLNSPQDFKDNGFVDELMTAEQLKQKLADLAVVEKFKDVKMVSLSDYIAAKVKDNLKPKQKIAVIFAEGNIVDGNGSADVAGDRFASIIAKVRADSTIKAVVLRVNSPGGAVLAAEKIKAELDLLRKDKPVIASYGDYAASGGYWISTNCDRVYSDASTLTGSIGVFSMIPDFSGTIRDIAHVNITTVGSSSHSGMLGLMRPLDAAETAYMQQSVEDIYERFVSIVSEGRKLEPDYVDSIAQGRVWVGSDAIKIGLVDEIGTLEDAIHCAAYMADGSSDSLDSWRVEEFPKPQTTMEMLMEMMGSSSPEVKLFKGTPFESTAKYLWDLNRSWEKKNGSYMFASLPYVMDIR